MLCDPICNCRHNSTRQLTEQARFGTPSPLVKVETITAWSNGGEGFKAPRCHARREKGGGGGGVLPQIGMCATKGMVCEPFGPEIRYKF